MKLTYHHFYFVSLFALAALAVNIGNVDAAPDMNRAARLVPTGIAYDAKPAVLPIYPEKPVSPVPTQSARPSVVSSAVSASVVRAPVPRAAVVSHAPAAGYLFPNRLVIPSIGVNAPVLGLGLEPDGKMDVPDNYTEIGWYKLGARPGEMGSAVMGAHVDNGSAINGVFKNLKNLSVGQDVFVAGPENTQLRFRVVDVKVYDYKEKSTSEIFGNMGARRLNLITCHGTFLAEEDTYNQRLVVFTELVEE